MSRRARRPWLLALASVVAVVAWSRGDAVEVRSGRQAVLELEGRPCALVEDAGGGDARGDLVLEPPGPDGVVRKHLGGVHYEDIVFDIDLEAVATCPSLQDWIRDTVRGLKGVRRTGALSEVDAQGRERMRLIFTNATLAEIAFPGLDTASKGRAAITLRATPEVTRRSKGTGVPVPLGRGKSKPWLQSQFRLQLDGLDTRGVAKIEPFAVRLRLLSGAGPSRDIAKPPGTLDIPNLSLLVSEAFAEPFYAWHEDFVIRGNSGPDHERNGAVEWLSPGVNGVLGALRLHQVGIVQAVPAPLGGQTARVQVVLYVERLDFGLK